MADEWNTVSQDAFPSDNNEQSSRAAVDAPEPTTEEFRQRARDVGWTDTVAFEYDKFQRHGGADGNWLGQSKVYEWSGEYGDVAPELPELEAMLYDSEFITREGEHRSNLDLEVNMEGPEKVVPISKFEDAGLHPVMLSNLNKCNYKVPTPIQAYAVPAAMLGHDVVAVAQTGSGKTAAYFIPIISKLMGKAAKLGAPRPDVTRPDYNPMTYWARAEPLVVVVVPTRELAVQIFDEARRLCYRSKLRPCVAYGGYSMRDCLEELGKGCDILIGTPGRLGHLMDRPDRLTMSRVKFTIIDEADEMLEQNWADSLNRIMAGGDANEDADHQYMMFSATFPKAAREMARSYMAQDHLRIRVGRAGQSHKNIHQDVIYVDHNNKREAVYDLLMSQKEPGRTLIFCNGKLAVDLLDDFLYNRGLPTTSIHGERNQREREDAIRNFRTGRAPILIATGGVSARGWDVKDVRHVINYEMPSADQGGISEYVHRIGRTARIGNKGVATSFYNDRNEDIAQELVNVLVECKCEVPDFLQHLVPEDGAIPEFHDDTDDEAEGGDDGWGGGGDSWGDGGGGGDNWGGGGDACSGAAAEPADTKVADTAGVSDHADATANGQTANAQSDW